MLKKSFEPITCSDIKILILGSLPGDRSLQQAEYYGHPQNRFWKIIHSLYQQPLSANYAAKINLLHQQKIGLWDVCAEAIRPGSMDLAIQAEKPNPLHEFVLAHRNLQAIFFNGQKSRLLFQKYFHDFEHIEHITLPSSSPANARKNFEELLEEWKVILSY